MPFSDISWISRPYTLIPDRYHVERYFNCYLIFLLSGYIASERYRENKNPAPRFACWHWNLPLSSLYVTAPLTHVGKLILKLYQFYFLGALVFECHGLSIRTHHYFILFVHPIDTKLSPFMKKICRLNLITNTTYSLLWHKGDIVPITIPIWLKLCYCLWRLACSSYMFCPHYCIVGKTMWAKQTASCKFMKYAVTFSPSPAFHFFLQLVLK